MRRFLYLLATDQISGRAASAAKAILWVLSKGYGFFLMLRRVGYALKVRQRHRLPCPVISIGNVTVGGSGKTPLTQWVVKALRSSGVRPAILIRGYMPGQKTSGPSDEAMMLKSALKDVPVITGADRARGAKEFLRSGHADLFVMDDGFQHWPLFRDLDIVAIDAVNPWGNGCLLPRGILREPKYSLSRADVFILTKCDLGRDHVTRLKEELRGINPNALVVESVHRPMAFEDVFTGERRDLKDFSGKSVCAVSSIAAPDSFVRLLKTIGSHVGERCLFMDHHMYTPSDLEGILQVCERAGITIVVTTQKDAVKLNPLAGLMGGKIQVWSLLIEIDILQGKEEWLERIHRLL